MADQSSKNESSPARATSAFTVPPQVRRIPASGRMVGSFVPRLTKKAMEKFGFSAAALLTDWTAIVGEDLARYTRPHKLKWPRTPDRYEDTTAEQSGRPGATLHLRVDGARALDVQYKGRQVIERINAYFGYRAVADLRIEQMPVAPVETTAKPRDAVQAKPSKPREAVNLGQVKDERLRAALERLQLGMTRR